MHTRSVVYAACVQYIQSSNELLEFYVTKKHYRLS